MTLYIAVIGAMAFWWHAEKKLGFGFRLLATLLLVSTCVFTVHYGHQVGISYDRGFVAEAFKTVVEGEQVPDQELYLGMIKMYKDGETKGGSFLWSETTRIQNLRKNKSAE